jgi:hypothetical protein
MGLALTATFAFCLWVFLWAIGVKSFDAMLITLTIILIAGGIVGLKRFLPSVVQRRDGGAGGW